MTFRKIGDAVIYGLGVYMLCGIAHNVIRCLTRPRYRKIIICAGGKGGGNNV